MKFAWLIRAALLALLVAAGGCVTFEEQSTTVRYDEATDELRIFHVYSGIGTEDKDGPTASELEQLDEVLQGNQSYFFDNWVLCWDRDSLVEEIAGLQEVDVADVKLDLDAPLDPTNLVSALTFFYANSQITNGPVYRDAEGRLCATQTLTITRAKTVVELINTLVLPTILEEEVAKQQAADAEGDADDDEADDADDDEDDGPDYDEVLILAAIRDGHRIIQLYEGGFAIRIPMDRQEFMRARHSTIRKAILELAEMDTEDDDEDVASMHKFLVLFTQDFQFYHHDGHMVVELGSPSQSSATFSMIVDDPPARDLAPALQARDIPILPTYDPTTPRATYLGTE